MLSLNKGRNVPDVERFTGQAFKTAGAEFEVIDSKTMDVLVPYGDEAKRIIEEMDCALRDERCRELLRKSQKYAVGIYDAQKRELSENHAIRQLAAGAFALEERFYDPDMGVVMEGGERELLVF